MTFLSILKQKLNNSLLCLTISQLLLQILAGIGSSNFPDSIVVALNHGFQVIWYLLNLRSRDDFIFLIFIWIFREVTQLNYGIISAQNLFFHTKNWTIDDLRGLRVLFHPNFSHGLLWLMLNLFFKRV